MKVTVKAWNQQAADQSVSALAVTPEYCKRHAKDTLDGRRSISPTWFFVSNGIRATQRLGFRLGLVNF
jgi:hypothetical protein